MRVCLIGGVFGKPAEYRQTITATPETTLLTGLGLRGCMVEACSHYGPFDFDDFDVVHAHHLSYGALVAAADCTRSAFVFTPHGDTPGSLLRTIAMRYVIRRADAVVALSQAESVWQMKKWSARLDRQIVIPNGIDSSTFAFVPPHAPSNGPWKVLYVGQLVRAKGIFDLFDALALIASHAKLEFELQLVYQVATREADLRAYARRLGLRNVQFLGARTPKELSRIYARSHFLVVPSLSEALPSVITEAMLVGRPVVATDVAAIAEQLAGFGLLVQPGSPPELARAIRSLIKDYSAYTDRAAEASRSARQRFSIDRMLNEHLALYERVLARGTNPRSHTVHVPVGFLGRSLAEYSRRASPNS